MTALIAGKRTLRIWQVVAKVGLSQPTIWRLSASGEFPKPIKISKGCTAWFEHEIDALLDAKGVNREADPTHVQKPERGGTHGNTTADADSVTTAETSVAATATAAEAIKPAKFTAAAISAAHGSPKGQRSKSNTA